jgi:hypothetical protein
MSAIRHEDREAAISAIQNDAGGIFRIYFFDAADGARLLAVAAGGDQWARGMMRAINDCARHIEDAPASAPRLCLVCPRPLRTLPGLTFSVVVPEIASPHHALGSAVCRRCAALPDLEKRTMVALRQIWPDLRPLIITHPNGGHA